MRSVLVDSVLPPVKAALPRVDPLARKLSLCAIHVEDPLIQVLPSQQDPPSHFARGQAVLISPSPDGAFPIAELGRDLVPAYPVVRMRLEVEQEH